MNKTLKQVRESKNMSLRELSKASGISYPMLRHYEEYNEHDPRESISWHHALALADTLDISVNDLLRPFDEA